MKLTEFTMPVSYSSFYVFDAQYPNVNLPWTKVPGGQGFVRTASQVGFATILEYGNAHVDVFQQPFVDAAYERAIAIALRVESGRVLVEGPEEAHHHERAFSLAPGDYRLTMAQRELDDEQLAIGLFWEKVASPGQSQILIADWRLDPTVSIVEPPWP